jgi:hypothetical protein
MQKKTKTTDVITEMFSYINNHVMSINNSKLFAGLMIIILNISSKFVTIRLSKTMESYLKHTFSRNILVYAIAWMGTRDIYIAFIVMLVFIILMDYLFNEDSRYCILPSKFMDYHISLLDNHPISEEDVKRAEEVLEKAKKQKEESEQGNRNTYPSTNAPVSSNIVQPLQYQSY